VKKRSYFVSNSSSSSFICEVCGCTESGMDWGVSDADMFHCENGHTVCNSHKLKVEEKIEEDIENDDYEDDYGYLDEKYCPLCCMKDVSDSDALEYLFKKFDMNKEKIIIEMKENYKTYKDFKNYIK